MDKNISNNNNTQLKKYASKKKNMFRNLKKKKKKKDMIHLRGRKIVAFFLRKSSSMNRFKGMRSNVYF